MIQHPFQHAATTREYRIPVTLTEEHDGIDCDLEVSVLETSQYYPFQDRTYDIQIPEDLQAYIKEEDINIDKIALPF